MDVSDVGGVSREGLVARPTKTAFARPARGNWTFAARLLAAVAIVGALAACEGPQDEARDCPAAERARTISGYCVPRYVSLKRGEVYGRKGPGKDYPPVWIYHVRDLPVQIVAETEEWRRVCDPFGGVAWVSRAMVGGRRTVIALRATPVPLRDSPRADGKTKGLLAARSVAALDNCQGGWCKVKAGGVSGWAPEGAFWGTAPAAQCR
jgi:SH3-like domain-containing protein